SYEKIVPHIQAMVAKEPRSYYVRGTFTRQNLDFTNDIRHFTELGLKNFSLEPAIGTTSEYAIREEDLPAVLAEYEKLADLLLDYYKAGQDVHFFHYDLDLQRGPCLAKRHTGCGAGVEYLVVTPEGDIYPCHQFVGEKDFLMGNVNRELDSDIRTRLGKNTLLNKEECRKCWARFYCGGGCHANNYFTNQSIEQPAEIACQMHRKRVESAIYLEISKQLHDFPAEKLCRKEG
ncbi:MAG: SPASM domain-containing protein, partial [Syntrophomonadaceae bacterium]|nr:SPASM domain-containing protein [Syntrophomonadaceae bacterium]